MGEFRMPSLGADMEAGTLVEWLKVPGDKISRGDIIAVIETQKGAIEIEIFEDGELTALLVEPGTTVPVGTPIAVVNGDETKKTEEEAEEKPEKKAGPTSPAKSAPVKPVAITPSPAPTIPQKPDILSGTTRPKASPAARRLAAERGVDFTGVTGTGPEGAITSQDIPAHAAKRPRGLDLGEMRKAIAAAMARSKREIPHYYLSHTVDLACAQSWLEQTNVGRSPTERLLMGALFLKASALALARRPGFNGFYTDDSFQPSEAVHTGLAVSIRGGGLVSPALRGADTLALSELMAKMRDLVNRARRGQLRSSELSDATVTISSLGERGVEQLYGVIYPPQVALIGFGAVIQKSMVVEGAVLPRSTVSVTLAADHRVSDGQAGARLLADINTLLQNPETL